MHIFLFPFSFYFFTLSRNSMHIKKGLLANAILPAWLLLTVVSAESHPNQYAGGCYHFVTRRTMTTLYNETNGEVHIIQVALLYQNRFTVLAARTQQLATTTMSQMPTFIHSMSQALWIESKMHHPGRELQLLVILDPLSTCGLECLLFQIKILLWSQAVLVMLTAIPWATQSWCTTQQVVHGLLLLLSHLIRRMFKPCIHHLRHLMFPQGNECTCAWYTKKRSLFHLWR